MNRTFFLAVALAALLTACENDTRTGGSLVQDEIEIVIDSAYAVTGRSVPSGPVQSRTTLQLLGRLDAEGYGRYSSDIVTQFMPVATIDTAAQRAENIDSVKLVLRIAQGGYTGDSITPMGVSVHRLNTQLAAPLYSDFNPAGTYDAEVLGRAVYSGVFTAQDTVAATSAAKYKDIFVTLPRQFGVDLVRKYAADPACFRTPQAFAQWFPGLYITTDFGQGRVTRIMGNVLHVYYHVPYYNAEKGEWKNVKKTGVFMGVTPEILTNNNITYDMAPALAARVAAGEPLMVAPCGYDMEVKFPAREIIDDYRANAGPIALINSLSFSLPVEAVKNAYGIAPPKNVLMVRKDKYPDFFADNSLPDGKTSFYATYSETARSYVFTDMRGYIIDLLEKPEITDDDATFILVPALVSYYTSSSANTNNYYYYYYYGGTASTTQTLSSVTPWVNEPVMAKFSFDKAKILFTYSKQTINF